MLLLHIDAFTATPFGGNAAGVCMLDREHDSGWMQSVAAELKLSATAFLVPREDGFAIRWFTPIVEIDLCGHATLASAHALWEEGLISADATARFHHAKMGLLSAERRNGFVYLDFPATEFTETAAPEDLLESVGVTPRWIGRARRDFLLELESEEAVRTVQPNLALLKTVDARGVIVTSASSSNYDFVSRFFAPAFGIDEDSVTGSSHCALGPFWAARLGRDKLRGYQASARGGEVAVEVRGDRVWLGGQAVTVLRGELRA
jgi:PhzF family phenazine biosynthesis protein